MYTAIAIIIVITSILLTLVVLVQNSKGGGLAANFAAGNQTFGVRQTATWTLAIVIIALCILATAFVSTRVSEVNTDLIEKIETTAPAAQPQFPVDPVNVPAQEAAPSQEAAPQGN